MQQCPECRTINRIGEKFCGECRCPLPMNTDAESPFLRIAEGPPSSCDIDLFFDVSQFLMVDSVFTQRLYLQALTANMTDFFLHLLLKDSDKKTITRSDWEPDQGGKRILRVNFKASEPGIPTFSLYVGYRRDGAEHVWKAEFEQLIVREYKETSQFLRDLNLTFSDNIRMGRADNIEMNRDLRSLEEVLHHIKPEASINEVLQQVRNAKPQWCRLRLETTRWRPEPGQWCMSIGSRHSPKPATGPGKAEEHFSEPGALAKDALLEDLLVQSGRQPARQPAEKPFVESMAEQLMGTEASSWTKPATAVSFVTDGFRVHLTVEPVVGIGRKRENRIVTRLYNTNDQATRTLNAMISRYQASIEMDTKGFRICPCAADVPVKLNDEVTGCYLDGKKLSRNDPPHIQRASVLTFPSPQAGLPGVFGFKLEPWYCPGGNHGYHGGRDDDDLEPDALVLKRCDHLPEAFVIIRTCFDAGVLHECLRGLMILNDQEQLAYRTSTAAAPLCAGTTIPLIPSNRHEVKSIAVTAWRQYFCSSDPEDQPDWDRKHPWKEGAL